MVNASTGFEIALSAAVGMTCVLSILGSGMIILSFVLFRELRTTMRYILLQLSIADLIVAVANLFGALYSVKFLPPNDAPVRNDTLCITQAAISLFSADASILWTIIFISYVYMLLACYRPKRTANIIVLTLISILSWVIPLVLVSVFAAKNCFGYKPGLSPGFCDIYTENNTELFKLVGYDIFLYSSFLVLPIFSTLFICHLCFMQRRHSPFIYNIGRYYSVIRSAELKLIFVPVVFMVIRVWGLILDISNFYFSYNPNDTSAETDADLALVFLTGIGDSAQGFVNGVFFVLLTPTVRYRLFNLFLKCFCCCCTKNVHRSYGQSEFTTSTISYKAQSSSFDPAMECSMDPDEDQDSGQNSSTRRLSTSLSNFSADIEYRSYESISAKRNFHDD